MYFKQPNYCDKLTDICIYIVPTEIKILLYKLCKSHWGVKTFYSPQCEFTLGCENFLLPPMLRGVVKQFSHPTTQFKVRIIELQVSLLDYQIGFSTSWPTASTLKILFDSLGGRPVILYYPPVPRSR